MNYQEYMKSPKWQEVRAQAMARADDKCEFCGRTAEAVHHVRYPQIFSHDNINNLVAACRRCHEIAHGIKRGGITVHIGDLLNDLMYELNHSN